MNTLRLGIVTCGFLGCSPYAPGTFGTLGGVALAWGLGYTRPFLLWLIVCAAFLYLVGRSLADWAEAHAGKKDPGFFVLDEVIGYLVTVAWVAPPTPLTLVVGFCVFRFFDILKPKPVRSVEALGGGDGILLDDVVAGLYGLAVMTAARLLSGDPGLWSLG